MKLLISALLLFISTAVLAQDKGIIQGVVLDKEMSNEPLHFANVYIKNSQTATKTDFDGIYNLNLAPGTYTLLFSFVGYEKLEIPNITVKAGEVTTLKDVTIGVINGISLEEVVAKASPKK